MEASSTGGTQKRQPPPGPLDIAVDTFVRDAGAARVVLMNRSGRLLLQRGFPDSRQVMKIATLAAGIHATGKKIGELVGDPGMAHAQNRGTTCEFFLSELVTPAGPILFLTVFPANGRATPARSAFEVFARTLGSLAGVGGDGPSRAEEFESSLMASLERLFPDR
ncbi:MAG: hypothetical protein R3E10_04535 [Gemmatimonadota bacterium]